MLPNGIVQVFHDPGEDRRAHLDEGTDTLRNIEQMQFADVTIPVPKRAQHGAGRQGPDAGRGDDGDPARPDCGSAR